jgi:hypothetical protein
VGRLLGEMRVESTEINTRGYESLLSLVENTANDSFDLYYGLFMYNQARCWPARSFLNVPCISMTARSDLHSAPALPSALHDRRSHAHHMCHNEVRAIAACALLG